MARDAESEAGGGEGGKPALRLFGRTMPLPRNRLLRIGLGLLLILGGLLGFLPVLGFWMIPLGLAVAALDVVPLWRWLRGRRR